MTCLWGADGNLIYLALKNGRIIIYIFRSDSFVKKIENSDRSGTFSLKNRKRQRIIEQLKERINTFLVWLAASHTFGSVDYVFIIIEIVLVQYLGVG